MNVITKTITAATVLSACSFLGTAAHAEAAQCDKALFPTKVQPGGSLISVSTRLPAGTTVCIKAGEEVAYVAADENGRITNDVIFNDNNKAKAISHYAYCDGSPSCAWTPATS